MSRKWDTCGRWVLGTVVACGILGCHSATERIKPSPRVYVPDIPLPEGFRMVDSSTESRQTGTRRLYLRHVYKGPGDKYAVKTFYDENMPVFKWSKTSEGTIAGSINMRFEKGTESCTVDVHDNWLNQSTVQVVVAQEEKAVAPPKGRESPRDAQRDQR